MSREPLGQGLLIRLPGPSEIARGAGGDDRGLRVLGAGEFLLSAVGDEGGQIEAECLGGLLEEISDVWILREQPHSHSSALHSLTREPREAVSRGPGRVVVHGAGPFLHWMDL